MKRLREGKVFLTDITEPILMHHARAELARDVQGRVRAPGVDHENFVGQRRDTFETARQVALLVTGDDARGNFHLNIASAATMAASGVMPLMQAKSMGHSRRKQGLHGT